MRSASRADRTALAERLAAVLGPELEYGLGVEDNGAIGLGLHLEGFERLLELAERGLRSEACGCHPATDEAGDPIRSMREEELERLRLVVDAAEDYLEELSRPTPRPANIDADERKLRDAIGALR